MGWFYKSKSLHARLAAHQPRLAGGAFAAGSAHPCPPSCLKATVCLSLVPEPRKILLRPARCLLALASQPQDMSMHFGEDPPLFSKPKNWGQAPLPSRPSPPPVAAGYPPYGGAAAGAAAADEFHVHNPLAQASSNSFSSVGTSAGGSFTAAPSAGKKPPPPAADPGGFENVWAAAVAASAGQGGGLQPPQQHSQPAKPPPPPKENPSAKLEAAFRSASIASLNKRLHASLAALAQRAAAEAEEQLRMQATLRQRGEQLQAQVAALQVSAPPHHRCLQQAWHR